MTTSNNRFTDPTPFTPLSAMKPEVREWHIKVIAAKQRYAQTNDPTELQDLGVLPKSREDEIPSGDPG